MSDQPRPWGPSDETEAAPPLPSYRPPAAAPAPDPEERARALRRIRQKQEFRIHLVAYLSVMALLVGIWAATTFGGYFWPIFPMLGWGAAVAIHGGTLLTEREPTEADVAAEVERLRRRGQGRLED